MHVGTNRWYDGSNMAHENRGVTWQQILDVLAAKWNFKLARIQAQAGEETINFSMLDADLDYVTSRGLSVLFNPFHNWEDHYGYFGSQAWLDKWRAYAQRYKNDNRIWAYQIFNEAHQVTWASHITTPLQVQQALAQCIDVIRSEGDNHPIVLPDPVTYKKWDMILSFERPNIIQGFHWACSQWAVDTYGSGLAFWQNDRLRYVNSFKAAQPTVPLIADEICVLDPYLTGYSADWANQKEFLVAAMNWCAANNINAIWYNYIWQCFEGHTYGLVDEVLETSDYVAPSPPPEPPVQAGCMLQAATQGTMLAGYLPFIRAFRDRCLPQQIVRDYYGLSRYVAPKITKVRRLVGW